MLSAAPSPSIRSHIESKWVCISISRAFFYRLTVLIKRRSLRSPWHRQSTVIYVDFSQFFDLTCPFASKMQDCINIQIKSAGFSSKLNATNEMWQNVNIFGRTSVRCLICTFFRVEPFFSSQKLLSFCKRSSTFLLSPLRRSIKFIGEESHRLGSEVKQMPSDFHGGELFDASTWPLNRWPGLTMICRAGGGRASHRSYHHELVTISLFRDASSAVSSSVLWLPYSWVSLKKVFTRFEDETTKIFNTQYRWD